MPLLAIVRHGQSVWNLENRFTGETDVDLTPLGRQEAITAGKKLAHIPFTCCFTSILKRAIETLDLILQQIHGKDLPVIRDKALDERNYGQLQGLDKAATAEKYGEEQVALWRRSYSVRPPGGESLKDTAARVIPYYTGNIEPHLKKGENILIVAHGNSLRALMMHLEHIGEDTIATVDLPTGTPRLYTFDEKLQLQNVVYL
ncbi:2,3-diphosphoglycerate-dependent phosphoglycerate mutase [Flavitalea sp. BT771]|uniref:2,3-bisphosphoglycerate-dependent phosphoglycerate mutase n=1 Tax=Flavitalea sp. BT771 TaxID=3063329 RepID=UPI0026E41D20|nr:2,3-diphosphoglycerate-dependent phosphoglycerate mutase [Flavitalea sp. BT771]MDO6434553.1 2,3-diphosphoglycerate-dependent phosphoglycerate mutase [Flavitalea sp. BT771]MDV6223453.1 2,3-diphosphoglycerate-dependent phosphoglycerate mutase [Flavitalea sp. BT771]